MTRPPPSDKTESQRLQVAMLTSPALFLRDVEPVRGVAVFTPMTEESYRASSFLDNRIVRAGDKDMMADLDDLIDLASNCSGKRRVIHYLFHFGHCGSTLLSRILGERSCYLSLREPPLLMGLSRSARALGRPGFPISRDRWESLKNLSLTMLAKTWRPGQTSLVKPTSHAGNLIPTLMRHTGRERAVLLYVDLETFLATMLRTHARRETRLYARDFRVREFAALAPGAPPTTEGYGDGQLAAMSWLMHAREMADALDAPDIAHRCMLLHFESFLADPRSVTERIFDFLGPAPPAEENSPEDPSWLSTAAKAPGKPYSADDRGRELALSRSENASEIADGLAWASAACEAEPFTGLTERFPPARAHPAPP